MPSSENACDISVVVRVAGRSPLFLKRALRSIFQQTRPPKEVIVSQDGGEAAGLEELLRSSCSVQTFVEYHRNRTGPAATANRGVSRASSPWIAFLDDDDTWDPTFIEKVSFAIGQQAHRKEIAGFVTQTRAVYEKFDGLIIKPCGFESFNASLLAIDLAGLTVENRFTNNAFVFARMAFDVVGPYDESLRALEDWDFNVRFARQFDIEVIPEMLANYHQRPADNPGPNSGRALQRTEMARIKNAWLRADISHGHFGLGYLSLLAELRGISSQISWIAKWRQRLSALRKFGRKWD